MAASADDWGSTGAHYCAVGWAAPDPDLIRLLTQDHVDTHGHRPLNYRCTIWINAENLAALQGAFEAANSRLRSVFGVSKPHRWILVPQEGRLAAILCGARVGRMDAALCHEIDRRDAEISAQADEGGE